MKLTLCLAACLLSAGAYGQYSIQKFELNPQTGSMPTSFTGFKGKTCFIANDGTHGFELWWTDGQSQGMVADINPGAADGLEGNAKFNDLCVLGGKLYFPANDGVHGADIWEYDGSAPPQMVTDLDTPEVYDRRGRLTEINGWLYFKARKANNGLIHLFKLSPVSGLCERIYQHPGFGFDEQMVGFNGKLLFKGYDAAAGDELCEYDPIKDTAVMIDIDPGNMPSVPQAFHVYKNLLFFTAGTKADGRELYSYDGNSAPRRITNIRNGVNSSFGNPGSVTQQMVVYNNKLYFTAANYTNLWHLYSYDPHTDAVQKEADMHSLNTATGMAVYGGKIYFSCDSNSGQKEGLFYYDGTAVKPISTLGLNTNGVPEQLTEVNGRLYFSDLDAGQPPVSNEPYVLTDAVALGVQEVSISNGVAVFPNPAHAELHIAIELKQAAGLHIALADVQGRAVYLNNKVYSAGRHEAVVPIVALPAGVYIYKVANDDGVVLGQGKVEKQ